jgi:hypothetical protein
LKQLDQGIFAKILQELQSSDSLRLRHESHAQTQDNSSHRLANSSLEV